MFRVDPAFKRDSLLSHIRGVVVEDYQFLQVTEALPIWFVHAREEVLNRYMFNYLIDAINVVMSHSLQEYALYVLLPEQMSPNGKLTTSLVTGVYECRKGRDKERRFEIATESGTFRMNERGSKVRKTQRQCVVLAS